MKDLKLTIDLLPKGAWGNNLSKTLPQKDWDTLREFAYKKVRHHCAICGKSNEQLEAHEVWHFDIPSRTQTLTDIIALCTACHGVKHLRHSQRIGYGKHAEAHFCKINECNALTLAAHYAEAERLFEERNQVDRWTINADLSKFGGKGIEYKQRIIPRIKNPYDGTELTRENQANLFDMQKAEVVSPSSCPLAPQVRSINVDKYDGTITVEADYVNKIQWISGGEIIKTKYNIAGKFNTKFCVEDAKKQKCFLFY